MALSNKLRRLALLVEPDVQKMIEKHAQRVAGHDSVRYDERSNLVTYARQGSVIFQPRAEKIAEYAHELGLFRWWFVGIKFGEHAHRRLDVAYREGEQYGLTELTTESITVDTPTDADTVAFLAAQLARADGVLRATQGEKVIYFALFDNKPSDAPRAPDLRDTSVNSPSQRPPVDTDRPVNFRPAIVGAPAKPFSIAPMPRYESTSLRPGSASRSMPPPSPIEVSTDDGFDIPPPPRAPSVPTPAINNIPIREPKRELFMPFAQTALGDVGASVPGFGQALLVVRVETSNGKGRFFVQLVALDADGDLIALDPSRALLDAAARMIADDARDGNGRWHKLAARLRPTERGASVDLDVV
jgi:hypothetical protein